MAWLVLGIAVVTEILWVLSLKWAGGQPGWLASAVPIGLSFLNMGLLAIAMRDLPTSTAYAMWTGLGAVGVALCGVVLFGEKLSGAQMLFMGMIVAGVVGTKLVAHA
ncbi:MAG: multidrug efflux SMR transporter [Sphingobium sp.]